MKNVWKPWLCLVAIIVIGGLCVPINFKADVFSLLPEDSATVNGLRQYQQSFGSSQALILAVSSEDSDAILAAMPVIAQRLKHKALTADAVWQSPFNAENHAMGELLAYFWLNQQPATFSAMADTFSPSHIDNTLVQSIESIATSFNAAEIAILANDPFRLSDVATSTMQQSKDPFVSADKQMRIMHLGYPYENNGSYWQYTQWIDAINQELAQLKHNQKIAPELLIEMTGTPLFVAEFGRNIIRDFSLAALGTLILVIALFWWAHRRWRPLLWLTVILSSTLSITIIAGMAIFGALNVVSLGFAAILMGLAVDYGLITYQEFKSHPRHSLQQLWAVLTPSILWAAVTTAGAFLMLARSSLPGLTELGTLVAIGIFVAALLVLYVYLPTLKSTQKDRQSEPEQQSRPDHDTQVSNSRVVAGVYQQIQKAPFFISASIVLLGIGILTVKPMQIETNVNKLQFSDNQARVVSKKIQEKILGDSHKLWVIVEADSTQAVAKQLDHIRLLTDKAIADGLPINTDIPDLLWPRTEQQQANINLAKQLATDYPRVASTTLDAGFSEDALILTEDIFTGWHGFANTPNDAHSALWPNHEATGWLFNQFATEHNGGWLALAKIGSNSPLSQQHINDLRQRFEGINGVTLVGWSLMAKELEHTMVNDVKNVFLPMAIVLVILLGLAFKSGTDIALSFATLTVSLVTLAAGMSLLNWQWNIMNMTALPLLLGAGVDYSIHIQLALKRCEGDLQQMFRSVGVAILLCGTTTAAALSSLAFTSNAGIASLGQVAALGIAISSLTAVFLLPLWWRRAHKLRKNHT